MSHKPIINNKEIPFVYKGNKLVYPNPVKDGLVLWYDFAGMRNTDINREIAKDLSDNGNDGTLQNFNYTAESGYGKNRLLFDGVDDYLEVWENLLVLEGKETLRSYATYNTHWSISGNKIQTTIANDSGVNLTLHSNSLKYNVNDGETLYTVSGYMKVNGEISDKVFSYDLINSNNSERKNFQYDPASGYFTTTVSTASSWIIHAVTTLKIGDVLEIEDMIVHKTLDENATTVQVNDKIYAYEDDKVVTVGEDGSVEVGGRNLVKNSNFATGTTDGWGKESGTNTISFSKKEHRSGGYSWKMEGNSSAAFNFSDYVDAKEGELYSFSFYGLLTGESFNKISVYIRLVFLNESGTELKEHYLYLRDLISQEFNKWHLLKAEGIEAPVDTKYVSMHIRWWDVEDVIYIDEIMLTRDSQIKNWTPAPEDINKTNITHSPLRKLKYYNRPLVKSELLSNLEIEENKQLKEGVPVQDGLVLHYDFSQETNDGEYREKAFDYSGNGNHGQLQNFNFTDESGYNENKLLFDGVDDYIQADKFDLSGGFTLDITFELNSTDSRETLVYLTGYQNLMEYVLVIQTRRIRYWTDPNDPKTGRNINQFNVDLGLQNIVIVYEGEILKVYFNGSPSTSETLDYDLVAQGFFLGRYTVNAEEPFSGIYHSSKVYNRPLTEEEIAHNYAIEKERFGIE